MIFLRISNKRSPSRDRDLGSDSDVFGFTEQVVSPEHARCRDSLRYVYCERDPSQHMFNRSARALAPIPHPLPLRQAVVTSFRSRVKSLPLAPDSLGELIETLQGGLRFAAENDAGVRAITDLRRGLFHAPGREQEGRALWREAVATAAFASELAREQGVSIGVSACAGLLHRVGDAFAQRAMALAESEHGVRMDSPTKSEICAAHGRDIAERLVREWDLPAAVGVCVIGWRRLGEFGSVSPEAGSVYVGHILAGELLHPYLTMSGALDAAGSELGFCVTLIARVREHSSQIRELVCTFE